MPAAASGRPWWARFFGVFGEARAWGSLLFLILSMGTGIVYFTWSVTGISTSAGLLVLIIGLPIFALFLMSARGIALLEGRLVEALLGVRMPRRPLFSRQDISWWQKFKNVFSERQTWTAVIYMIMQMPLGIIYFSVLAGLIGASVWLIGRPIWELVFDMPTFIVWPYGFYTATWAMPFVVIGGILLLFATMHLAKLLGKLHGAWAKLMLVQE